MFNQKKYSYWHNNHKTINSTIILLIDNKLVKVYYENKFCLSIKNNNNK